MMGQQNRVEDAACDDFSANVKLYVVIRGERLGCNFVFRSSSLEAK
jgi:hypothetical protein